MIKKLLIGILVLGMVLFLANVQKVKGGGFCTWTDGSTLSASKVTATVGEEITLTLKLVCTAAPEINLSDIEVEFSSPDAGLSLSPSGGCTGSGGVFSTKIKSSTPGTKTIQAWDINGTRHCAENWPGHTRYTAGSITLNFVAASSTTTTKPKTTTTTATKPAAPTISTINNSQLPDSKVLTQKITAGEPITFSGKTIANATVKLYIYSEPITAEAKSDANGDWSYTLTQELAVGEHRVEAQVTDASSNASDKTQIATFTVRAKPTTTTSINEKSSILSSFTPLTYGLLAAAVILIGVLIFLIIRRRRKAAQPQIQKSPPVPPAA